MNQTRAHPLTSNPDPKQNKQPFPTQPTKLRLLLKYPPNGTSVQVLIWTARFNVQNGPRATSVENALLTFDDFEKLGGRQGTDPAEYNRH